MVLATPPLRPPQRVEDAVILVQKHTYSWNRGTPINCKLIFWNPLKIGKKEYFGIIDWRYLPVKSDFYYEEVVQDLKIEGKKLTFTDPIDGIPRKVYFMHYLETEGEPDVEYYHKRFIKEEWRPGLSK